jgi:hypothetical protein
VEECFARFGTVLGYRCQLFVSLILGRLRWFVGTNIFDFLDSEICVGWGAECVHLLLPSLSEK